jgi:hypothetical protein
MAYSNEIDLPLEATVMGGDFDETNKDLILTLQNKKTITIPLDAIISGLATEVDVEAVDVKSYYDHVITTEAEFLNIGKYSGKVLVKGVTLSSTPIDITLKEGTHLTFIDFNMPSEGELSIDGTSGTIRGFHVSALYATVTLKNFSNVKQVSCKSISRLCLVESQHISDSKFYEATSCTYIDNCDLSLLNAVYINNCKYVCGIRASSTIGVGFSNCSFISNVDCNGTYENCTYVVAESCKGFVQDEGVGKVQVITNDGTFQTAELGVNLYEHYFEMQHTANWEDFSDKSVTLGFTFLSKSSTQLDMESVLSKLIIDEHGKICNLTVATLYDDNDWLAYFPVAEVSVMSGSEIYLTYIEFPNGSPSNQFISVPLYNFVISNYIIKEIT